MKEVDPCEWPLRIFYDRSCPLCAREMHTLAAHDQARRLVLIDMSAPDFVDAQAQLAGLDRARMNRLIHAQDARGHWYRGIDVFALAYAAVGLDSIARIYLHPRMRPIWERLYPWIARHRMALSRLGLARPYAWLIRRAARRAQRRPMRCAEGNCER